MRNSDNDIPTKPPAATEGMPAALAALALRQVAAAILDGEGPLASGVRAGAAVIGEDEVGLIRRILFSVEGADALAITRIEAEVLFELNDRTDQASNDPAWSYLFVKAIASVLLAARGQAVLPRSEFLQPSSWIDEPPRGVTSLFGDLTSALVANSLRAMWRESTAEAPGTPTDVRTDSTVTSTAVRWLADRIGRDGVLQANERALLRVLGEESPDLHPSLQTLLDTAA
jgi:hypothetical protein